MLESIRIVQCPVTMIYFNLKMMDQDSEAIGSEAIDAFRQVF